MMFCVVVFRFKEWNFAERIGTFLSVELIYVIFIFILRPYESKVDMFIEFMNEAFYLYYISFLWAYKTEDSWSQSSTDAFFWLMIANNLLIVVISNCKLKFNLQVYKLCQSLKLSEKSAAVKRTKSKTRIKMRTKKILKIKLKSPSMLEMKKKK